MVKQTDGANSDAGIKYERSVLTLVASLLSKNENVENYRIFSNPADAHPFDDIVAEVHFKELEEINLYAIQVKSGKGKLDVNKYYDGYNKITREGLKLDRSARCDRIHFWYFWNRVPKGISLKTEDRIIDLQYRVRCRPYNKCESIFEKAVSHELYSDDSRITPYQNMFENFSLFLNQPDTQKIIHRIKGIWHVNNPWQIISFLDSYFARKTNVLDKATFEYEILKIRLSDSIVTPTKAIAFKHEAAIEWNRLTLDRDVTIVQNVSNVEQYLFGCILRNIADVIDIDEWNGFVDNEGKLDSDVKGRLKRKSFVAETLKDLMLQTWIYNRIPLILRSDGSLLALKDFSYLKKKYIIIDSNIARRSAEIESYGLQVFRHLGDVAADEMMKTIPVSLQGREPTSLHEIIDDDKELREAVTCFDVINLMVTRKAFVNQECLNGNDCTAFLIETANPQSHGDDEQHPSGSNIVIYCEPRKSYDRYLEIKSNPKFGSYKIFRLCLTEDDKLMLISNTHEPGTVRKDGFIDQNGESIYYMDNGDVIPIIGEVLIDVCRRYVPRYLREGVKTSTNVRTEDPSNKISIKYRKNLLAERDFSKYDCGKIIIISGEPGMGKTSLLHSLFHYCESKYYVLFFDLARHQLDLRDGKLTNLRHLFNLSRDGCNSLSYKGFLKGLHRCSSLPYNSFLTSLREYSNRLVIILDSFDEVVATCERQVFGLIQNLQKIDLHKVIIASRLTALDSLLNHIEARVFKIEGIGGQSVEDYKDTWNLDINNLRHIPSEFLANPLYLNMIRTVLESGANFSITNRWCLYESIVDLKMENYCQHRCLDEDEKQSVVTKHGELALKVVLGINEVTKKIKQWTRSNFICLGFITHYDNENPVFVHRTFAEFFVAKWLIKNAGRGDAAYIYRLMLENNQADVLNIHSERFSLHKAILDADIYKIKHISTQNNLFEVDDLGRSALHLAVIHYHWSESNILKILNSRMRQEGIQGKFNIYLRDKVMKWTCVDYFKECEYIKKSNVYSCVTFKEIYWHYFATHIEELDDVIYSLRHNFNNLYRDAICNSSISLLRDLLFLKYRGLPVATKRELLDIYLSDEKLQGIHLACIYSNTEAVKVYIENRGNLNKADKFKCTPLHYSVIAGEKTEIVKLLLENDGISNLYDDRNNDTTILHMSVRAGNGNVTKMLLDRINTDLGSSGEGFPEKSEIIKKILTKVDNESYTVLDIAIEYGSKPLVTMLIKYYAALNLLTMLKSTYFCRAIERRNRDIIQLLLDHGANPNCRNEIRIPALVLAIENGDDGIVQILLDHHADVNVRYDQTPLCSAVATHNLNIIEILLRNEADVNHMDSKGRTPLIYAIKTKKKNIVQLLLDHGADVNLKAKCGTAPLFYAIKTEMEDIVKMLVNRGADVNLSDQYGRTPLYTAMKVENASIVEILLKNRADVNSVDKYGRSPLLIAVSTGNVQLVKMLLDGNANVNFRNESGLTGIYVAEFRRDDAMVDLLMEYGAGPILHNVGNSSNSVDEFSDVTGGFPYSTDDELTDSTDDS